MARFVVTRVPGPAWDPASPTREQAGWHEHAAFMDALASEGFVAFGGPADNEKKTVLIVDAPAAGEIQARLALDPWTASGLLRTMAIEAWTVWLGGDERIHSRRTQPLRLVTYRPGPGWEHGRPRREQAGWEAHAAFMDSLTERGLILLGGPLDEHRALVVLQHDDEPALRAELAGDPWHDGILTIERVEPWVLWLP